MSLKLFLICLWALMVCLRENGWIRSGNSRVKSARWTWASFSREKKIYIYIYITFTQECEPIRTYHSCGQADIKTADCAGPVFNSDTLWQTEVKVVNGEDGSDSSDLSSFLHLHFKSRIGFLFFFNRRERKRETVRLLFIRSGGKLSVYCEY